MPYRDSLYRLQVARPCREDWDGMVGDERRRHCNVCGSDVYNAAGLSPDELAEIVRQSEGELCLRLTYRANGTLVTKDCRADRRRRIFRRFAEATATTTITAFVLLSLRWLWPGLPSRKAHTNARHMCEDYRHRMGRAPIHCEQIFAEERRQARIRHEQQRRQKREAEEWRHEQRGRARREKECEHKGTLLDHGGMPDCSETSS
ncbi:MAG: hypothetical protein AAGF12_06580 [Myxococcota bacterium]